MKIALLGNMNNNNFALLRYLRDLGAEAHLLPMSDDGVGPVAHFHPKCDTWQLSKWEPYIHQLDIPNRYISMLGNQIPWRELFWIKYQLARAKGKSAEIYSPPIDFPRLKAGLTEYDKLVGSGVMPSILASIGRRLDVFYPYATGIEWVNDIDFQSELRSKSLIRRIAARAVRKNQIRGIRRARHVAANNVGYTSVVFDEIGITPSYLQLPMVYRESCIGTMPETLVSILERIANYDLKIISHVRHQWVRKAHFGEAEWDFQYSKHNDWTIRGYAAFRRRNPSRKSILILSDYGVDAEQSQSLCADLGISDDVMWIPRMPRIEIMEVIAACDFGLGEFFRIPKMLWGGTALEFLACGKPLIHGFNFSKEEYRSIYGHPPPPMCVVDSEMAVAESIERLADDGQMRSELGRLSEEWFSNYNGKALAQKWLELITR